MLWRFITHNKYVIGFLSIIIFLVSGCSDNKDSAKNPAKNPAEGSVETTLVDFGSGPYLARLLEGWSLDEKWPDGTSVIWSNGGFSKMEIVVSEIADKEVILRCLPFDYPGAPEQSIKVSINDKYLVTIKLDKGAKDWKEYKFPIPASDLRKGENTLTFEYGNVKSPSEVGQDDSDTRPLAVAFDYMKVESLKGTRN